MDVDELTKELKALGISSNSYSLIGGLPNERYCLSNEYCNWFVYYSERGHRVGEKRFDDESKACEYLLEILKSDPTTRK